MCLDSRLKGPLEVHGAIEHELRRPIATPHGRIDPFGLLKLTDQRRDHALAVAWKFRLATIIAELLFGVVSELVLAGQQISQANGQSSGLDLLHLAWSPIRVATFVSGSLLIGALLLLATYGPRHAVELSDNVCYAACSALVRLTSLAYLFAIALIVNDLLDEPRIWWMVVLGALFVVGLVVTQPALALLPKSATPTPRRRELRRADVGGFLAAGLIGMMVWPWLIPGNLESSPLLSANVFYAGPTSTLGRAPFRGYVGALFTASFPKVAVLERNSMRFGFAGVPDYAISDLSVYSAGGQPSRDSYIVTAERVASPYIDTLEKYLAARRHVIRGAQGGVSLHLGVTAQQGWSGGGS